jgi:hypothetical protein
MLRALYGNMILYMAGLGLFDQKSALTVPSNSVLDTEKWVSESLTDIKLSIGIFD